MNSPVEKCAGNGIAVMYPPQSKGVASGVARRNKPGVFPSLTKPLDRRGPGGTPRREATLSEGEGGACLRQAEGLVLSSGVSPLRMFHLSQKTTSHDRAEQTYHQDGLDDGSP
ncbi:hypothetical protein PCANC_18429 [Puccinia coronata f. sp. avenae]|uniref:Uncharacterized protein n=1 Tax=Puccinia coronata f. sp. avenae TaxID=200324 RepID=A0A2N5SK82_9BASI|nr:hypothetical protein PCANC_18429 [Puccinia coronata f. sp. avenae]PLW36658.1 hypothetical protein PCASD_14135 [Puccinia coronata f. sp. avenae]